MPNGQLMAWANTSHHFQVVFACQTVLMAWDYVISSFFPVIYSPVLFILVLKAFFYGPKHWKCHTSSCCCLLCTWWSQPNVTLCGNWSGAINYRAAFSMNFCSLKCLFCFPSLYWHSFFFQVFVVTGFFSFLAYVWLFYILRIRTENVIELWEASLTFALFPILILFAYLTDQNYFGGLRSEQTKGQIELDTMYNNQSKSK